jgi:non-specific protein-tyrosine kinase
MSTTKALVPSFADYELSPFVDHGTDQLQHYVVPTNSHRPDDPELYRQIFSGLDLDRTAAVSVIGVVSAIRGEGRTTIASRLAVTLAADLDQQVSLIEVDLERPCLAKNFNVDSGPGLCAVLEGTQRLDAVACTVADNLSLVPAGAANGSVARLLRRLGIQDPFHHPDGLEGVVILDLPPLLSNSYGALAAQLADATLLVVRAGVSPVHVVREAIARLDNRPPHGIIFNDFHSALPRWWPGGRA